MPGSGRVTTMGDYTRIDVKPLETKTRGGSDE